MASAQAAKGGACMLNYRTVSLWAKTIKQPSCTSTSHTHVHTSSYISEIVLEHEVKSYFTFHLTFLYYRHKEQRTHIFLAIQCDAYHANVISDWKALVTLMATVSGLTVTTLQVSFLLSFLNQSKCQCIITSLLAWETDVTYLTNQESSHKKELNCLVEKVHISQSANYFSS